jgi:hypothetical protein
MSDAQREILESLAKSQTAAHREVTRAEALLLAADGLASTAVAYEVGVSPSSVVAWRSRFAEEGLAKLGRVRPGRGRKPQIPAEKIDEIVRLTQESKPEGETHWSCRSMAKAAGVSPATVQRVWSARGLKPHLVRTFKLSNDRRFDEKLIDVVGVYLNPPDKAVVLCMDEKSQIQALHPDVELMAEHGRTLVPRAHRESHPPRCLQVGARPDRCDRGIPPSQQQRSQAVRMDRHGRGDPRESQPRPGRTRINPG